MEKDGLPRYSVVDEHAAYRWQSRSRRRIVTFVLFAILVYLFSIYHNTNTQDRRIDTQKDALLSIDRLQADYATCSKLRSKPTDPSGPRERSRRYVEGHEAYLIRNATIWTGEPEAGTSSEDARAGKGHTWIRADVFMQYGLIKRVAPDIAEADLPDDYILYDARGRQLTSGIVDMHSHAGVNPLPDLRGSSDDNELSNDITPYVRSIDGLNPLDPQIQVIKSGGVTTSLILPGSGNNMGGEAYVVKHAVGKTGGRTEISAEDMLADPDKNWRYMKMACGENPKRVYGAVGRNFGPFSRLGEAWYFRHAFEQASALVAAQDDWCNAADKFGSEHMSYYLPQELEWESLSALLRGQVLLNTHCYTVPDLEAFIRHTNEFKFSIRAFHHAHQTYLVPEILKRAYGGRPPAAALFADSMYYKAEAYIASEQAGKILWDNGITPVYVSDNPVINAQHVVFEAAKAYRNGLPYHVALAGVTSASAELLGLGERVGKVKAGFDADVVVWDSDPLSVGASPVQVWIDGTPQFEDPVELKKPVSKPLKPKDSLRIVPEKRVEQANVLFTGVSRILLPGYERHIPQGRSANVVVTDGSIICVGDCEAEIETARMSGSAIVSLENGHLAPALTAFGSSLGLVEIPAESITQDGFNGDETFSRAVDGLALDTKNLDAAYSHGVTRAISPPLFAFGGHKGVSVGFSTGALHSAEKGAVWLEDVALHYTLTKSGAATSLSSAVGQLRAKLLKAVHGNETEANLLSEESYLKKVVEGRMALAITVDSADLIASLLKVKGEVDSAIEQTLNSPARTRLVIIGGAESYLLADALAEANVGVVLAPMIAFSEGWDQRRSLTGAPLTNGTAIDILHAAGVTVAIGTNEDYQTRDLYLTSGIAHANSDGKINETEALAFTSSNVYRMLGLEDTTERSTREFVVFDGSPLEIDSRIRAIANGNGKVSIFSEKSS